MAVVERALDSGLPSGARLEQLCNNLSAPRSATNLSGSFASAAPPQLSRTSPGPETSKGHAHSPPGEGLLKHPHQAHQPPTSGATSGAVISQSHVPAFARSSNSSFLSPASDTPEVAAASWEPESEEEGEVEGSNSKGKGVGEGVLDPYLQAPKVRSTVRCNVVYVEVPALPRG